MVYIVSSIDSIQPGSRVSTFAFAFSKLRYFYFYSIFSTYPDSMQFFGKERKRVETLLPGIANFILSN